MALPNKEALKNKDCRLHVLKGVVYFSGNLNEYSDFTVIDPLPTPLHINFKDLESCNSLGIRNLIKFLLALGKLKFHFSECPVDFVRQINAIPALLGDKGTQGQVHSFEATAFCEKCETTSVHRFEADEVRNAVGAGTPIDVKCTECGEKVTIETEEEFGFLLRT